MRPLHALLALLSACVAFAALPAADAGALKEAVLTVAEERAATDADRADLAAARLRPATDFAPRSAPAGSFGSLAPLRTPLDRNPYARRLVEGARASLAKPDVPWPRVEPSANPLVGNSGSEYDVRGTAAKMDALLWLFTHPESPLRHDPEVLGRLLRRLHTYVDVILVHRDTRAGQNVFDDFAISPALFTFREFAALHPNLLLPAQRARLDEAFRVAAGKITANAKGHLGRHAAGYANIDLTLAYELLNLGLHLRDDALLSEARVFLDRVSDAIQPDGATAYIWHQNESIGYHDTIASYLARIHDITRDEFPLQLIRRLEWYGPVSIGRAGEFWTAPSWKQQWNAPTWGGIGVGGEFVVATTGNPYVRGLLPRSSEPHPPRHWHRDREVLAWYRDDVAPRPLPENYTILDRNIAGPRAWYGNFNYAATLRDIPLSEPGHATLMGAQVLSPDGKIGSLLMGVYPRVHLGGARADARSFAWLSSGLRSSLALGRTWSAFAATYQLHRPVGSGKGALIPWFGRQLWLTLPDRVVGVLELLPESASTPPAALEAVVRLGVGGTVTGTDRPLVEESPGRYRFGDLRVTIHASNFAETRLEETAFRLPRAPFRDVCVADRAPSAKPRRVVVEIAPVDAAPAQSVQVGEPQPGLIALRVATAARSLAAFANFSDAPLSLSRPATAAAASLHRPQAAPPAPAPASLAIAPGEVQVLVDSGAPEDHQPSWPTLQALLQSSPL